MTTTQSESKKSLALFDLPDGVLVYTTKKCRYCEMAKKLLQERHVPFRIVDFDAQPDDLLWDELSAKTGMNTVPMIFHNGLLLGGHKSLCDLDEVDGLESLKI